MRPHFIDDMLGDIYKYSSDGLGGGASGAVSWASWVVITGLINKKRVTAHSRFRISFFDFHNCEMFKECDDVHEVDFLIAGTKIKMVIKGLNFHVS